MSSEANLATFARRVREHLVSRNLTIAALAERAELAPSLVSKLLTETDAARREPTLEHVLSIARSLEISPGELVAGTGAERLLGQWVLRTEFVNPRQFLHIFSWKMPE
jgi:transcriptional regulator with XRE-family HTH domain